MTGAGWFYLGYPGKGVLALASLVLPICLLFILGAITNVHFCCCKKAALPSTEEKEPHASQSPDAQFFKTKFKYHFKHHKGCLALFTILFVVPMMVLAAVLVHV